MRIIKLRRMRWAGLVSRLEKRPEYSLLVEEVEGRRPLGRPRRRRVDDIKVNLVEIGRGGVDWIGLTQGKENLRALGKAKMSFRVRQKGWKIME
jgi:hypothetical protein